MFLQECLIPLRQLCQHGAFEIIYSLDDAVKRTQNAAIAIGAATVVILVLIVCAVWFIMRNSLVNPLLRLQIFADRKSVV